MERVVQRLREVVNHEKILITSRGNSAIFIILNLLKNYRELMGVKKSERLLIPDQGIWTGFKNYSRLLGLELIEMDTNDGLIDLSVLKEKVKNAKALLVGALAGYHAEQPVSEISRICKANNCLLVIDASGVIGDNRLCNGAYADFLVGSFNGGSIKAGYGGFVSTNNIRAFDSSKEAMSLFKVYPEFYDNLYFKLGACKRRLNFLYDLSRKTKEELKNFKILNKEKQGINIIIEKHPAVVEYCHKLHYNQIVCPSLDRVNEQALSIELKDVE